MKDITKEQSKMLKGIAIIFMVCLHLYNTTNYNNLYTPLFLIKGYPVTYFLSFICDACVPIYCFCAGYAVYLLKDESKEKKRNRLIKLLITYWVILVFTCIAGLITGNTNIPDSFTTFIGNALLYNITYVGAWWFMQTYVLLTLCSKIFIKIVNSTNKFFVLFLSLIIYFIAYYFRIIHPIATSVSIINYLINASVLVGTSQLLYIVGIYFCKDKILNSIKNNIKHSNIIGVIFMILSVLIHMIIKTMMLAPFTGLLFIVGFLIVDLSNGIVEKVLLFFGKHSTNIWLVHMQFYMIFCSKLIFSTNTVLGCFIVLLTCCIICSYVITFLTKIIYKIFI